MRTTLVLWIVSASTAFEQPAAVDLAAFRADSGVAIQQARSQLTVTWPMDRAEHGVLVLNLEPQGPLIAAMGSAAKPDDPAARLMRQLDPVMNLTVGTRNLEPQGWMAFFDNPPKRPHQAYPVLLERKSFRVESQGRRSTVIIDGVSAGPFRGDLRFTVYPGCRLVHAETVISTEQDACAILYDAGLTSRAGHWKTLAWLDTSDRLQRLPVDQIGAVTPVAVRHRTMVAESYAGSLAIFPPPHQFLYPLDFADNFQFTWHGRTAARHPKSSETSDVFPGFGVRQPPEGDKRFVPWVNAPPRTQQRLGVFYLLSDGSAEEALREVQRFTHGDRFPPLEGYRTFTSHYHIEHTLDLLRRQREQPGREIPSGLEDPPFVRTFKNHGVEIVHLAEFHVRHTPEFIEQRLVHLDTLHRECRRLSNDRFLLLPGEEPNVHLGGHWISFFPKPVYWLLHPPADAPFEREVEGLGTVYAVKSADDILKLMERENGLMWTAHARTKSSFGFPDRYREQNFYKSDRFLGAAWKAMPADYSLPRLGVRCLDLLDDMANWGDRKYLLGEVDVFKVMPDYELYGHMNINYLRLDEIPRFDDGWQPVLDALLYGRYFVSTGEVLMPEFRVDRAASGETLKLGERQSVDVTASLQWTFPPAFAEVIWGDGERVHRQRIDLTQHAAFSHTDLRETIRAPGAKWIRLEAWDVATNGAFSQPVWIE
jgi:hypothetical protein